ncbi:MAG: hypothetical protein K2I34_09060 [Paramuribaculum sp.]|nr:hypothetical protein [Paramuribaculum sp.]
MKKILYMLMSALPLLGMSACSDDDKDLPYVDINVEYAGAKRIDGTIYAVAGEPFEITSVSCTPLRQGKKAAITAVTYGMDGWVLGATNLSPFSIKIDTSELAPGKHVMSMSMIIAEVDCEVATGYLAFDLVVVPTAEDMPDATPDDDTSTGTGQFSISPDIQD